MEKLSTFPLSARSFQTKYDYTRLEYFSISKFFSSPVNAEKVVVFLCVCVLFHVSPTVCLFSEQLSLQCSQKRSEHFHWNPFHFQNQYRSLGTCTHTHTLIVCVCERKNPIWDVKIIFLLHCCCCCCV